MADDMDDNFDDDNHEGGETEVNSGDKKKHMFIKERKKKIKNSLTLLGFTESNGQHFNFIYTTQVKSMMYGFGDEETPCQETVELLEEMVINFIQNMTIRAMELSKQTKGVQIEDLMFLLRKDQRKYARAKDLLIMNEELKKARKAFDEPTKY